MEEGNSRRRVWLCWASASSSMRILWFVGPLIMVSVVVALMGSKASNCVFDSQYYPWIRSSVTTPPPPPPSSSSSSSCGVCTTGRMTSAENPVLSPNESGRYADLDLQSREVVDGGGTHRVEATVPTEAISDDRNLSNSASSSVTVEQAGIREEIVKTLSGTNILPPVEEQRLQQRKYSNLQRLESGLILARAAIKEAKKHGNETYDPDYIPTGPLYWNANAFHRSYLEMERQFKVFVYDEGEPPIFHNGPCKSIYAMEGNFIYFMETAPFKTRDPEKAHVYFLPMSVTAIVHFIYDRESHNWDPMRQTVRDYVNHLAGKYPYWNRSLGADHFMLACHDWGPELSSSVSNLYKNSIRALCNANTSEGFKPSKDVSFPEIHLPSGTIEGLIGGPSPSRRPYLVFFAGGLHGPIRPVLLKHWENKDENVQIHQYLPKGVSYHGMMKKSKYCICPSGYEVASPRMVEALYTGCVPVLIKDHYVPPFSDVLNWKSFSLEIPVKNIPNLKEILMGISSRQYIRMQRRGKQVRKHFEVNLPPKRYDVFHMILHSVWLRRLNIRLSGIDDL